MNKMIKTGVLSYGMSGKLFHCPFISRHVKFDLVAIVERHTKQAQLDYPNIKSYDKVDDLLKDTDIELVVVNTPNVTHYDFSIMALQAGKHVLLEKPFTVTLQEAKSLYTEAKKQDRFILPFQNRRFDSDFLSVKRVVESGVLGDLIEVHFRYDRYTFDISNNVTKELGTQGNGLMYNLGPHLIDAAISLFGAPAKYHKITGKNRPNTQVDDYAFVHMQFNSGLQVFITASLLVAEPQAAFVLHGTKGSFVKSRSDVQESQLQSGMKPDNKLFGKEAKGQEGLLTTVKNGYVKRKKVKAELSSYLNMYEAVYQTLRCGQPFLVTENDILKQMEILES
ncbi:Gfo/Idh/MocA family oxidoreductase [Tamlana fucoidanivorans]|uniref:Oxidoreductase n=1 Tax=Allotamlana fucoidanivorans TaxID=2583814 RepID=A0A5C4SQH3_9FLAO|nr:Gfo/Idh/MocA family oxidoreductase [Tamlana fucoidanivorans]TNJ45696.1 oxidoreductase [Tamlana fucoidanivorans]